MVSPANFDHEKLESAPGIAGPFEHEDEDE
jgi:hypothetical protein